MSKTMNDAKRPSLKDKIRAQEEAEMLGRKKLGKKVEDRKPRRKNKYE